MSLTPEEAHRLYQTLGELEAQMAESGKQRDALFELIREVSREVKDVRRDIAEVRVDVAEHRQEFNNHTDGEDELVRVMNDYKSNKNRALGMLAVLGMMVTFAGIALSTWIKSIIDRLMA